MPSIAAWPPSAIRSALSSTLSWFRMAPPRRLWSGRPACDRSSRGAISALPPGANLGIATARSPWIALLNPDATLPADGLGRLVAFLRAHPRAAAVSPQLRRSDGSVQPYGYGDEPSPVTLARRAVSRLLRRPRSWHLSAALAVDWVSGACLVARQDAFELVGLLDERFFLYFEDVDWCRRCRRGGWETWVEPSVSVVHDGKSDYRDRPRRALYRESLRRYYQKHYPGAFSALLRTALALSA